MNSRVGKTQAAIVRLLSTAEEDGLTIDHLATSLGSTKRAIAAAVGRLKRRGLVVTSSESLIVWLPERRLNWLESRAAHTAETNAEIRQLNARK